jgi:hypothetical protein
MMNEPSRPRNAKQTAICDYRCLAAGIRFWLMKCDVKCRLLKVSLSLVFPSGAETHWILCNGRGCLALVDRSGKWKCFATGRELIGLARAQAH